MIVGSCILPERKLPQLTSTTLEAKGVHLLLQQLKDLKAITTERDEQRKRVMGDEEWRGLLDHAQCFFLGFVHPNWASPFATPHFGYLLCPCHL